MKISKVKNKNLYRCSVRKPDGSYKSIYGKTKKEVREKADSLSFDIKSGKFVEDNKLTFSDWIDEWSDGYLINVSETTKIAYISIINNHLKPYFKNKRLQKITHNDVQRFVQQKTKTLSPKTVHNIYLVIHRSLKDAQRNGYISLNPADNVILPKKIKQEMLVLDKEEIEEFLDLAYLKEPDYADCFEFMILTGLRLGEFIGLTEDCYNSKTGSIKIIKQYQPHLKKFVPPKHGVKRMVYLPQRAIDIVEKRLEENKTFIGVNSYNPNNLIFCNTKGNFYTSSTLLNALRRVSREINKPELRLHDLRHTYATLALASGVDIKTLQHNLGHADATFTMNKYAHSTNLMNIDAANKINDFLY